jgi:hypothetical protein
MPLFRSEKRDERQEPAEVEAPPPPGPHLLMDGPILTPWFMTYRIAEELQRSRRYGAPLCVLVAEPQLLAEERLPRHAAEAAAQAATKSARNTDLVGWLDDGRIAMVLCETDAASARFALSRLRDEMWLLSYTQGGQKWTIELLDNPEKIAALIGAPLPPAPAEEPPATAEGTPQAA